MKVQARSGVRKASRKSELAETKARLAEAEETLRAIRHGEVDALVVAGPNGDQVFTLQGAEAPYRFLVEEMNEGALLVSAEGTVLYANARFAALAGRGLEEVIGSPWKDCFAVAEQPALEALVGAAREKGGVKAESCLLAGGSCRPVEISLAWMQREGLEGLSVVVADLTERKAAEEALQASNAKLREMVDELERFSYSISHDMRAPLRAMKSFALMLEESCATCLHTENLELMGRISGAANRLDELIQGSLDYARVVKGELVVQPVALDRLMDGILKTYLNLSPEKADIQVEGSLPVVLGNEAALTQVFSNLLGNAVKFVAPGTRPRVRIWTEKGDAETRRHEDTENLSASPPPRVSASPLPPLPASWVRIWVQDNGIGIPLKTQARMFEMFQRGNSDYEGTGIGLAVVRKAVERMGGRVGVESEPGSGSRFWVELKAADAAVEG